LERSKPENTPLGVYLPLRNVARHLNRNTVASCYNQIRKDIIVVTKNKDVTRIFTIKWSEANDRSKKRK